MGSTQSEKFKAAALPGKTTIKSVLNSGTKERFEEVLIAKVIFIQHDSEPLDSRVRSSRQKIVLANKTGKTTGFVKVNLGHKHRDRTNTRNLEL